MCKVWDILLPECSNRLTLVSFYCRMFSVSVCFAAKPTWADSGEKLLTLHSAGSRWAVTEWKELQHRTDWGVLESCFFPPPTWMYKYIIQIRTAVYLWCSPLFYSSRVEIGGCVLRSELCLYSWPDVSESCWGMPSVWPAAVWLSRKSTTSFPGELFVKCLTGMSGGCVWSGDTSPKSKWFQSEQLRVYKGQTGALWYHLPRCQWHI